MRAELARIRLRGVYAVLAGGILLIGIPLFQAIFLTPVGYVEAVAPIARHGDFGPLLAWVSENMGADIAYRVVQLIPFLMLVPFPLALRRALWPVTDRTGVVAAVAGMAGIVAYALALAIGTVSIMSSAAQYNSASSHATVVASFAGSFAFTTLLSRVIGGLLIAVLIALASWRMVRARLLLAWVGYFGFLVAVLLAITAIQYSADLTQVETTMSPFSFATLSLWLVSIGVLLSSLRRLPEDDNTASAGTTESSVRI